MRVPVLLALSILLACTSGGQSSSQQGIHRIIRGDPTCEACEVRFVEVATLGGLSDPASVLDESPGRDCMVAPLSTGEFAVSGIVGGGEIFIYDGDGSLARRIGRSGEGPGEFGRRSRLAVGPGDTLFVMDDTQFRLQVITASGEFVRSFPFQGQVPSFALLDDGDLLFHRMPWTVEDPLFYLYPGAQPDPIGFGNVGLGPDEVDLDFWVVSPAARGRFWTGSIWTYEAKRFLAPDSMDLWITREVDWFPPGVDWREDMYEVTPPATTLHEIREDNAGRVWAFVLVPDSEWEPGIPLRPRTPWYRGTFDTVVEIIDPADATVIADGRYPTRLGRMCGSHLVYTVVETEEGDTRLKVLEPVLVGLDD